MGKCSKQYLLKEISPGKFVYSFIGDKKEIPPHFLCTNCFEGKIKSIMQLEWMDDSGTKHICPKCKNYIKTERGNRRNRDITFGV